MSIHHLSEHPLPPELAVADEPLSDEDLARYFALDDDGALDPDDPTEVDRWSITTLGEAEWAMRKYAQARRRLADLEAQRDEWLRRVTDWFDYTARADQRTAEFFAAHLERYAVDQRVAGGPATLSLPAGQVKTTVSKPAVEVVDDEVVAHWLDRLGVDDPAVVKWTPKVYVAELRKMVRIAERQDGNDVVLTDAGELVPGVRVRDGKVTAKVVPS